MPKVVDREQRRRDIAETVWHIIAAEGIAAVTLRSIAARADISMGRVQHYFTSRDEIIQFALSVYLDAVADALPADLPPDGADKIAHLRSLLTAAIPRTEARKLGAKVWYAYLTEAITDPAIGDRVRSALRAAEDTIVALVDGDRLRARTLLATVDGLVYRVLVGQIEPAEAERLVTEIIDSRYG